VGGPATRTIYELVLTGFEALLTEFVPDLLPLA
jgi:hypothetical protein